MQSRSRDSHSDRCIWGLGTRASSSASCFNNSLPLSLTFSIRLKRSMRNLKQNWTCFSSSISWKMVCLLKLLTLRREQSWDTFCLQSLVEPLKSWSRLMSNLSPWKRGTTWVQKVLSWDQKQAVKQKSTREAIVLLSADSLRGRCYAAANRPPMVSKQSANRYNQLATLKNLSDSPRSYYPQRQGSWKQMLAFRQPLRELPSELTACVPTNS